MRTKDKFDELFGDLYIGKYPTRDRNSYLVLYLNFSGIVGELSNYREGLDAHCQICFDYFCEVYADLLPQGIKERLDEKDGAVNPPTPYLPTPKACTAIPMKHMVKVISAPSSIRLRQEPIPASNAVS